MKQTTTPATGWLQRLERLVGRGFGRTTPGAVHPRAQPGWSGNGMVATLNGTGFMFERLDHFGQDFIEFAGRTRQPVLELGCAYGNVVLPALAAGGIVTASDMDQGHLDVLADKVPAHLRGNLQLALGKLPEIEFPEGKFAAIFCSRVLHFLEGQDIETSVAKMARWLAPGGRLYLIADTPYGVWRKAIPQFEAGKLAGHPWPGLIAGLHNYLPVAPDKPIEKPPFMNLQDPDLLARVCRESGLEILQAEFISRPDFGAQGKMDGRENAGVIATRPGQKNQK
jgi:SAM-dependent methyltransferase